MSGEIEESLPQEPQIECEATGSDAEHERGGKQAKFDDEDSDNDSTVSSSNSNSTQASIAGKRGFRGKGRKKRNLAFRCVNFLKVNELRLIRIFFSCFVANAPRRLKRVYFPLNVNYLLFTTCFELRILWNHYIEFILMLSRTLGTIRHWDILYWLLWKCYVHGILLKRMDFNWFVWLVDMSVLGV